MSNAMYLSQLASIKDKANKLQAVVNQESMEWIELANIITSVYKLEENVLKDLTK